MNRAIVNFIKKYNKAIEQTAIAAAAVQQAPFVPPSKPLPRPPNAAVQQAIQSTQQAANAAVKVSSANNKFYNSYMNEVTKLSELPARNLLEKIKKNYTPALSAQNKAKLEMAVRMKKNRITNKNSAQYEYIMEANRIISGPPINAQKQNAARSALTTAISNINKLTPNSNNKTIQNRSAALRKAIENANSLGVPNKTRSNAALNKIQQLYKVKVNKQFLPANNSVKQAFATEARQARAGVNNNKYKLAKPVANQVWYLTKPYIGRHGKTWLLPYSNSNSANNILRKYRPPINLLSQGITYDILNSALSNRGNFTNNKRIALARNILKKLAPNVQKN
jgi:hypothetical protein